VTGRLKSLDGDKESFCWPIAEFHPGTHRLALVPRPIVSFWMGLRRAQADLQMLTKCDLQSGLAGDCAPASRSLDNADVVCR
jgi:hypothetical protein